jgi:uncharacterized membrane protein HdeD (DUF308 family)
VGLLATLATMLKKSFKMAAIFIVILIIISVSFFICAENIKDYIGKIWFLLLGIIAVASTIFILSKMLEDEYHMNTHKNDSQPKVYYYNNY